MYMYIGCSTWGYELASFPCYQKMPKCIVEVVHAGISSLKIKIKKKGDRKKKDLICARAYSKAQNSKRIKGSAGWLAAHT